MLMVDVDISDCRVALRLIRMAIEETCPPGVLPSEEAVNGLYGPEPIHEAEALATAIYAAVEKLTAVPVKPRAGKPSSPSIAPGTTSRLAAYAASRSTAGMTAG
ncbi:hypothetical protein NKH54_00535 [Mesorhizobium sp. M1004]|uniref:hypothetical protein n=1 Tax=Mesorhizobium sp. M1004 TaxID=2957046 RepID=UPI0033353D42